MGSLEKLFIVLYSLRLLCVTSVEVITSSYQFFSSFVIQSTSLVPASMVVS